MSSIMNIYSPRGTVVTYTDTNGYECQREDAKKAGFIKGQNYTVAYTSVGRSSTSVVFHEIEGSWNSVMFENFKG